MTALVFLAPLLAFYSVYYVYSFIFLGQMSTKTVDLSFTGATDVGWHNFYLVLTDPVFWRSIENNLFFAGAQIAIALTLGFFLAVSLASGVRFRRFFYVAFLLPSLIPLSLFATVFGQMLETNNGAINQTLRAIGLGSLAQDWTGNTGDAYAAIIVLLTYLIGLPVMYYTSDLATANTSVLEAAMIDGASSGQMYRLILFPMLRNTHKTVILSVLLGSFRWFELVYFSTNSQPGGRTGITGTYIYDQMFPSSGGGQIGYAAAASLVVLVIAIAVSAVNVVVTPEALMLARTSATAASSASAGPLHRLRQRRRDSWIVYAILVIGAALWLFPLITVLRQSIQYGGVHNYVTVLTTDYNGVNLIRAFANSLVIAAITVFLTCGIGALAAYAFSKLDFPGRETLYHSMLLLLAVPAVAVMIPVYWITGNLGMFNTPIGVSLPETVLTLPFAVLLLRNYADGIPNELVEAARVDGAGHGRIFRHVFLPLCRPALINLGALCVVWSVQDFLFPSMLLNDASQTTAAQAVQTIKASFGNTPLQSSQYFAALMLLAVPAIAIVVVGLKWITQGVTAGGVKE